MHIRKRGERIAKEAHRQSAMRTDSSSPTLAASSGLPTVEEDGAPLPRSSSPAMGRTGAASPDLSAVSDAAKCNTVGREFCGQHLQQTGILTPQFISPDVGERETAKRLCRESQQPFVSWSHFLT